MQKVYLAILPVHYCFLALFLTLELSAAAQQTPTLPASQGEINQQLLLRIQELEKEVQDLRAQPQDAPVVVQGPATEVAPVVEQLPKDLATERLKLNFFGDTGYQIGHVYGPANTFELGEFDLFATSRISSRVSLLGEILFTAQPDNRVGLDVERLLLKYKQSDYFAASIGRIHTAIGYYNTAFNRGDYFQTPIGRPAMYDFDDQGGFLPMQDLGVVLQGKVPSGKLGLNYVFEVTNGRAYGLNVEPAQNSNDANNSKAVNVNISAKPDWGHGLEVGFSLRHDYLSDANNLHVSEIIPVVFVVYSSSKYEWLNEGMLVRHATPGGPVYLTPGFYTQFSRRFGPYRPYFRYSYVNASPKDPIYGNPTEMSVVGRFNGSTLGLRYDFTEHSAFKLQYDRDGAADERSTNGASGQFAFTF